jgi:hypothetical protein
VCKNEAFIDTRPPPAGTPSNLEGEFIYFIPEDFYFELTSIMIFQYNIIINEEGAAS